MCTFGFSFNFRLLFTRLKDFHVGFKQFCLLFQDPIDSSLMTMEESLKPIHRLANSSQAANDSGVKMLVFSSGNISQNIDIEDEESLLDCGWSSIQEIHVRSGKKIKSEIQELKDTIQEKECLIKDLKAQLATSMLDDSWNKSKITKQNAQLEEQNELLVKKSKKIEFLEKRVADVLQNAEKTEDQLRSSLRQMEVENSKLRTKIQSKNSYIEDFQDLTEKLAGLTSENSRKESKITEQSAILAKSKKHIQFLENQISKNLETSEMAIKAFKQEKDKLKSNLRQSEVQASELRTDVQSKVEFIHNLETKVAELTNEVVTNVKANTQLELERNSLEKKCHSLEAKISDLESQSIVKDQMYRQLDTEKQGRMKQLVTTANKIKSTEDVMDLNEDVDENSVEFDDTSFQLYLSEVRNC